jgi:multidrug resistance efflux pump
MEVLLLGIYAFCAWLVFFKFKWLPWNITTQVITITLPVVALTILILFLNIVAPSSHDVRVINYVVPVNPRVAGLVTEVPIVPNQPVKKGDVLFKIDPTPFEAEVKTSRSNIQALQKQAKAAAEKKDALVPRLALAQKRVEQYQELAASGAGNKFDIEQSQADAQNLASEMASLASMEAQAAAEIEKAKAQLANAQWSLEQTVYYAPADGKVIALTLRPGAMAVPLPMVPAMNFVEDEQWVIAIYEQNQVRKIEPSQEAEVAFNMYPGRVVKCKVDSIMWATAQGQLPIGSMNAAGGVAPIPPDSVAVRLLTDAGDKDLFLAAGAHGSGAVYTDSAREIQILRKVFVRVKSKINWLILKLH